MKLICTNKYILKIIFGHLNYKKELNIIKYNKKYKSKLNITLYSYQKIYFYSIITQTLKDNSVILLKNKTFDKNTLDKLLSDWKYDSSKNINENDCFHFRAVIKKIDINNLRVLNTVFFPNPKKLPQNKMSNLIELNISNIVNLELPCSTLENIETFSLKNIRKLRFLNFENNISLNKLKHLYIDNTSFNNKNNIKIHLNNLKYLDLRLKEEECYQEGAGIDNNNNTSGFNKECTIKILMKIFGFQFLSVFNLDIIPDDFPEYFKNTKIFNKNYLNKYDYLNFEISYRDFGISGAAGFGKGFKYQYLFSKTKGNKYLFETKYKKHEISGDDKSEYTIKEVRYCDNIDYENYFFINYEMDKEGCYFGDTYNDVAYEKIQKLNFIHEYDIFGSYDGLLGINILNAFDKNNNCLETLSIDVLDLIDNKNKDFFSYLTKFDKLKCFYINKDIIFEKNKQFIKLMITLSKMKSLFIMDLTIDNTLNLDKNSRNMIKKIFPGIKIQNKYKKTFIKYLKEIQN